MKKIILALVLILVVIQFILALPENSPEPQSSLLIREDIPKDVQSILKSACNDCHSNSAIWPWYAHVAPLSFWIGDHVEEGREHFNLSEWENYEPKKKAHKIEELVEMVEEKEMPLEKYVWLHSEAELSADQRATLISYFKSL
ncbi:heme-binding domain-containing protein [Owenweeksia hongkongensis]|uniref:heme-binding domain-containing protein n=1 Tax=Owenweeksia hongkongensis TaxID=253245 RepID=UPI003A8F793E